MRLDLIFLALALSAGPFQAATAKGNPGTALRNRARQVLVYVRPDRDGECHRSRARDFGATLC